MLRMIALKCPRCGKGSTTPHDDAKPRKLNCGDCLMNDTEVVEMIEERPDDLIVPAFLRREATPEALARIKRITHRSRDRKIKNPPKRVSKNARMLGAAWGSKIKST